MVVTGDLQLPAFQVDDLDISRRFTVGAPATVSSFAMTVLDQGHSRHWFGAIPPHTSVPTHSLLSPWVPFQVGPFEPELVLPLLFGRTQSKMQC